MVGRSCLGFHDYKGFWWFLLKCRQTCWNILELDTVRIENMVDGMFSLVMRNWKIRDTLGRLYGLRGFPYSEEEPRTFSRCSTWEAGIECPQSVTGHVPQVDPFCDWIGVSMCVIQIYPSMNWTNAVEPDLAIAAWSFGTCGWHWHCLSRVVRDSKPPTQPSCGQWCDFGSKLFEPQIAIDAVRASRNGELEGFILYSIEHHGRPSHLGAARELHAR